MRKLFIRRGFSDRLYLLNFISTWVFVIFCYILTIFSGILGMTDLSIVSVGIPAAFTQLGLHTGFIVWKAKVENLNKHKIPIDESNIITQLDE